MGGFATLFTLTGAFVVVIVDPVVQIILQLFNRRIHFPAEGDPIKFLQDGFMKALTNTIGLGMPRFGSCVLYIMNSQEQLKVMAFSSAERF